MFKNAASLEAKPTAKKKQNQEQHELRGLEDLAKLNALIVAATSLKKVLEEDIKNISFDVFMEMDVAQRPSSFKGVEGAAVASVEMRKRGVNCPLNDDECKQLEKAGFKPFKQIITQELYAINPLYAHDAAVLKQFAKALHNKVPVDFIVKQPEVFNMVVSDELLDKAFKRGKKQVLRIMTTMALKTKLSKTYNITKLIKDVTQIMQTKKKPTRSSKTKVIK